MENNKSDERFSLDRRLKRQVQARKQTFWGFVSPGLEQICGEEIKRLGAENIVHLSGRITFEGKLENLYQCSLHSRITDRFVMVINTFRAVKIEELFKKVEAIPWELYIWPNVPLDCRVFRKQAKLGPDSLVVKTVMSAIRKSFEKLPESYVPQVPDPPVTEVPQRIFISLEQQHVTISLDASGEPLHKRGYRKNPGLAPLQETLAAAVIEMSRKKFHQPVVDGMTGSGTLIIEAVLKALKEPPGKKRDFPFFAWPAFKEATWRHLVTSWADGEDRNIPPMIAMDINVDQLDICQKNASRARVSDHITFVRKDFLHYNPRDDGLEHGLLLLNLPYGKRMTKGKLRSFYHHIGSHLKKTFRGWKVAILFPASGYENALGIRGARYHTLTSGGSKIRLLMAKIK